MKTTPTLGLKLYDGTDAPDLVSGYNASMETLDGSGVLAFQGTVQDSTDWDTIIDAGYYNCNNTKFSSANHSPVGSYNYGVLVVYNRCPTLEDIKCVTQIYYPHAGDAANRAPVSRAYYSNAWSAWAPLVDVPDVEGALPANG
uniref:pyocin knob domain-containing protein n=1 Tax=uncultured Bifidobacterium sp. TaxID=165187 RepID=UPI00259497F4